MAYTAPTASIFKVRYPEFSEVSDALVDLVLAEAINFVGEAWDEDDRAQAQMLHMAHTLTLEGEPERSQNIAAGGSVSNGAAQGEMTSMKVGDVSMTFASRSAANAGGASAAGSSQSEYCRTVYGARFYELMQRNITPVLTT